MKRLRDQGLSIQYIDIVFQAIIVSRILYALPAWECFLSKEPVSYTHLTLPTILRV